MHPIIRCPFDCDDDIPGNVKSEFLIQRRESRSYNLSACQRYSRRVCRRWLSGKCSCQWHKIRDNSWINWLTREKKKRTRHLFRSHPFVIYAMSSMLDPVLHSFLRITYFFMSLYQSSIPSLLNDLHGKAQERSSAPGKKIPDNSCLSRKKELPKSYEMDVRGPQDAEKNNTDSCRLRDCSGVFCWVPSAAGERHRCNSKEGIRVEDFGIIELILIKFGSVERSVLLDTLELFTFSQVAETFVLSDESRRTSGISSFICKK